MIILKVYTLLKIFEKRIKNEQYRPQIYHIRPSNSEKIRKIKCNLYWSSVCRNGFKFISMVFSNFKNPMIGWYFSYIRSKESRYFHRSHIGQSEFSNKPMLVKVDFLTSRIGLFWTKFKIRAMRMPRYNFYFGAIYFNKLQFWCCLCCNSFNSVLFQDLQSKFKLNLNSDLFELFVKNCIKNVSYYLSNALWFKSNECV